MLSHVCPEAKFNDLTETNISRIGKKKDGPNAKSRPIKVRLQKTEHKQMLIKNSKKLKSYKRLEKVGISYDKTYREILRDRALRTEKDAWIESGKITAVIYDGRVMLREEKEALVKSKQAPKMHAPDTSPNGEGTLAKNVA